MRAMIIEDEYTFLQIEALSLDVVYELKQVLLISGLGDHVMKLILLISDCSIDSHVSSSLIILYETNWLFRVLPCSLFLSPDSEASLIYEYELSISSFVFNKSLSILKNLLFKLFMSI